MKNSDTVSGTRTEPEYTVFRAEIDKKPVGFHLRAEDELTARRKLTIAASRLGFDPDDVDLVPER